MRTVWEFVTGAARTAVDMGTDYWLDLTEEVIEATLDALQSAGYRIIGPGEGNVVFVVDGEVRLLKPVRDGTYLLVGGPREEEE